MKVIFAQGNPGPDYASTRHNVGWLVIDAYGAKHEVSFDPKPKFFAEIAELMIENEKILLVKPTTYYNETGKSLRALTDFYKLVPATDILVLHDELALPFGTLRTREKGSDAGNNGIKSLNAHIGADYHRLRIGIANDLRERIHDDSEFVLGRFSKEEQAKLESTVVPKALEIIGEFIVGAHATTSYRLGE